jgi:hypothetical protein
LALYRFSQAEMRCRSVVLWTLSLLANALRFWPFGIYLDFIRFTGESAAS